MKKGTRSDMKKMGHMKVAKINGLARQPVADAVKDEPERASNDERVRQRFVHFFKSILEKGLFNLGRGNLREKARCVTCCLYVVDDFCSNRDMHNCQELFLLLLVTSWKVRPCYEKYMKGSQPGFLFPPSTIS